ncbi:MAG: PhnD/SsuA/transferrin family substrate-binding protein [Bacteroidia bacterium]
MNQNFKVVAGIVLLQLFTTLLYAQLPAPLRVGVVINHSAEDVIPTYAPLMDYIAAKIGTTATVIVVAEEDLASDLMQNKFDIGIFTPFPYLKAKEEFPVLEVFATHLVDGKKSYEGCILVRKGSGINSLGELEGKNFQYVNRTSTSGYKFPRGIFWENDLDVDRGFFNYDFSTQHQQSLAQLLLKETDGVAIMEKETRFLDPEDLSMLKCLLTYDIPYEAYVFSPAFPHSISEQVKKIMFTAYADTAGLSLLTSSGIDHWVPQTSAAYYHLQRYDRVVRSKPSLQFGMEIRAAAKEKLEEQGDLIALTEETIIQKLNETGRFSSVGNHAPGSLYEATLNIARIGDIYACTILLNGKTLRQKDFVLSDFRTALPLEVKYAILENLTIESAILKSPENEWFIPYGVDDGITPEEYRFELVNSGKELMLQRMSFLNTFFHEVPEIQEGMKVHIHYQPGREDLIFSTFTPSANHTQPSFWDSLDNVWGVVGLVVAFLSVALGSYFTNRKKKRFKNLLYQCNDTLLQYLRGYTNVEELILQRKAAINQTLEKGLIREDQFLILIHRLEDIEYVIQDYFRDIQSLDLKMRAEIETIIKDGIITEKEYTRIVALIKASYRNSLSADQSSDSSSVNTDI